MPLWCCAAAISFLFAGDLKDEIGLFEWLISDDNRELDDAIEEVSEKMLLKLIDRSPLIAVYFCKDTVVMSFFHMRQTYFHFR